MKAWQGDPGQASHISLGIGEVVVADPPAVISTVLGSCVAVCVYSLRGNIAGMNHFALPQRPSTDASADDPYRYGDDATAAMLDAMLAAPGVQARDLRAKLVGGALQGHGGLHNQIGELNIAMARQVLASYRIPIVAEDTGGTRGRKVLFDTATGKVRVSEVGTHLSVPELSRDPARPVPSPATSPTVPGPGKATIATPAPVALARRYRVLIIDDSKTIQTALKEILGRHPRLEVVGIAENPLVAEKILASTAVDIITLDIQMPVMDGVTYLGRLMEQRPLPVVMISSLTMEEGDQVLRALEMGAVDYIQKPKMSELAQVGHVIGEKVYAAATARVQRQVSKMSLVGSNLPKTRGGVSSRYIVAIGASTGGTEAIKRVLRNLPAAIPPIVIVQHIPAVFSRAFAQRLNDLCPFEVKEAEHGDKLLSGRVLVAPGGLQMSLVPEGMGYKVAITDDPPVNRHKPSVDVLFHSVARHAKDKALGIILTGMGADGAAGLLAVKQAGSATIAQDEHSSVIFGMPKEAILLGAVDAICDLDLVPKKILAWMQGKS